MSASRTDGDDGTPSIADIRSVRFSACGAAGTMRLGRGDLARYAMSRTRSYEARITEMAQKFPCVVLCLHPVHALTALVARYSVFGTHPQMLEAGVIQNPFFVPVERRRDRDDEIIDPGQGIDHVCEFVKIQLAAAASRQKVKPRGGVAAKDFGERGRAGKKIAERGFSARRAGGGTLKIQ